MGTGVRKYSLPEYLKASIEHIREINLAAYVTRWVACESRHTLYNTNVQNSALV